MEGATQKMRGELDKLNQIIIILERSWADRKMMTSCQKSISAFSAAHLLRKWRQKKDQDRHLIGIA
jgi:hypothetical protein